MARVIELSEDAYQTLRRVAEQQGVTPSEWVASTVSRAGTNVLSDHTESAEEALAPFIGAVDSGEHRSDERYRSGFGDILDEKFAKQGINPAKWAR